MSFKLSILAAAVLATSSLGLAHAQTGSNTAPKGQLSTPNQDKGSTPRASVESRAEVKADVAAAKAAASMPQGQQSTANQGKKPMAAKPSDNARSDVKAEASAANKAGTMPKGQESVKDQNKGGVKP
jgi:hypothetical protein